MIIGNDIVTRVVAVETKHGIVMHGIYSSSQMSWTISSSSDDVDYVAKSLCKY